MVSYDPYTDEHLLSSLKSGDEKAFETIYQQFSGRLYGSLLNLVKSEEIARELLQDVFLKVWEKRELIDPGRSFRSYLFRIAENRAYDFFRKVASDKELERRLLMLSAVTYSHVEEMLIRKEADDLMQRAIEALPPRRRQVFRLCKLEEKSYEEVAGQLEISISTISDHIVKATHFIRKYYSKHQELLLVACLCSLYRGF